MHKQLIELLRRAAGKLREVGNLPLRMALLATLAAGGYWIVVASDRYVSEAHVLLQSTDGGSSQLAGIGSLLGSVGGGIGSHDQLQLRDYLLSVEVLNELDAELGLRKHYSQWGIDPLSRMWIENRSQELFHNYFLSRISVEFDDYAGVLVIKAQAFDPEISRAIVQAMVREGERHMNELAHRLAQEQVDFLQEQAEKLAKEIAEKNAALLAYQNKSGMVSPQDTVATLAGVINSLEAKKTDLKIERSKLLGYLSPTSSSVTEINLQIEAIDRQINQETSRLTSPKGKPLNKAVEEYERLKMEAAFALDMYKGALVGLEQGRLDTMRKMKKVSVLQSPSLPQYAEEPRRLYNTVVFALLAFVIAGIINLMVAIIRDHKD